MWEELLGTSSAEKTMPMLLLLFGVGSLLLTAFVWIGGKVLALRERPDRRALITAAAAYAGASLFLVFGSGATWSTLLVPIFPLPGAVVVYFWLRRIYRAGWVEDDQIPEGMKLENNDWRVGLGVVAGVILAAAIKVAFLRAGTSG